MTATAEGTRPTTRDDEVDHPPFARTLPRVNLLPASVAESFTLRRIHRYFIAVAVLLVLGFSAIWYLQSNQIADAQAKLDEAQAASASVSARVEELAPIKQMYDQITNEQELVATTLASEPQAALVINRMVETGTGGGGAPVEFTSIAIEYRGVPSAGEEINPCPNPDPFATDITIGCVTFSGAANTRDQVSAMLNAMAADPLFVGPYVNSSTVTESSDESASGITFTGTAGLSIAALKTELTDEQIAAIIAPPAPAEEQSP
jgi:Tfp pilus assembly protein PilN